MLYYSLKYLNFYLLYEALDNIYTANICYTYLGEDSSRCTLFCKCILKYYICFKQSEPNESMKINLKQ